VPAANHRQYNALPPLTCGPLFQGPYICKDGVELRDSFEFLLQATEHEKHYPSTADDSTSANRRLQYIFTRVLNKLNSLMEISDTQAAVTLLGFDISQCSESFWLYDSASMHNFIHDEYTKEGDSEDEESVATKDSSSVSDDSFIDDDVISEDELEEEEEEGADNMLEDIDNKICDQDQHAAKSLPGDLPNCPFEAYHGDSRYGRKSQVMAVDKLAHCRSSLLPSTQSIPCLQGHETG